MAIAEDGMKDEAGKLTTPPLGNRSNLELTILGDSETGNPDAKTAALLSGVPDDKGKPLAIELGSPLGTAPALKEGINTIG